MRLLGSLVDKSQMTIAKAFLKIHITRNHTIYFLARDSIRCCVGPLVRWSIGPSVGPLPSILEVIFLQILRQIDLKP